MLLLEPQCCLQWFLETCRTVFKTKKWYLSFRFQLQPGSGYGFSKISKLGPEHPDQKHCSFIVDCSIQAILTDMESYLWECLHYQSSRQVMESMAD
jgi:hypothetical protein